MTNVWPILKNDDAISKTPLNLPSDTDASTRISRATNWERKTTILTVLEWMGVIGEHERGAVGERSRSWNTWEGKVFHARTGIPE